MANHNTVCQFGFIVLVLSLIAPKSSSASIRPSNNLDDLSFTKEEVARGRWEAYRYHGIRPDEDYGKDRDSNKGLKDKKSPILTAKKVENPTVPKKLRTRSRELVFKGRFGGPSMFDADSLKLPGKKGIGYTLGAVGSVQDWTVHLPRVKFLNTSWNYSWNHEIHPEQPSNIEFIPMIWTAGSVERVQEIMETSIIPDFQSEKTKRLMGFNEPDLETQANMDVDTAIYVWPALESAGMPLASPSVTSAGIHTWMKDWNEKAYNSNLRVDYIAVHWYGWADVASFKSSMREMYRLNGGETPLLITEFAPADWKAKAPEENRFTREEVLAFMKEVLPWIEQQDWITGYAWFPFRPSFAAGACSCLFEDDGTPTPLALYYASVTPENPDGDQSISY